MLPRWYVVAVVVLTLGAAFSYYMAFYWVNAQRPIYISGTGQRLYTHRKRNCLGRCPIHAPTNHWMVAWRTHWRWDRGVMERLCPHGIGHPDPDDLKVRNTPSVYAVHGCDGCCSPDENFSYWNDGGSSDY